MFPLEEARLPLLMWAWVLYPVAQLWHQRLVLGRLVPLTETLIDQLLDVLVCTPDLDVYSETYNGTSGDIAAVRFEKCRRNRLPGVLPQNQYRFRRDLTAAELRVVMRAAFAYCGDCGRGGKQFTFDLVDATAPVVVIGSAAPLCRPASSAGQLADSGPPAVQWVWAETTALGARGKSVKVNGKEIVRGEVGLHQHADGNWALIRQISMDPLIYAGREAAADARLMDIEATGEGRKRILFRDAVAQMTEEGFKDWPIDGPRTVLWCCQFIDRKRGGPLEHYQQWVSRNGLSVSDYGVTHYQSIMRMLDTLVCWDQVDAPNLSGVEVALRQVQLYEYSYAMEADARDSAGPANGPSAESAGEGGPSPKAKAKGKKGGHQSRGFIKMGFVDEAAVFAGTAKHDGMMMVCPLLLDHVAKEVERDTSILKQVRKAREERRALAR